MNSIGSLRHSGFTLVELLIVIIVVAILAVISTISFGGVRERADESALAADLRNASQQLEAEKVKDGRYPEDYSGPEGAQSDNSMQYSVTDNGEKYCITGIRDKRAMRVTTGAGIEAGICDGHTPPGGDVSGEQPIADLDCPTGFISVPGNARFSTNDFCVMKYEAKNDNGVAVSQPGGTIWTFGTPESLADEDTLIAAAKTACERCRLVTQPEWLTIAHNILGVGSNWTGGQVGSGSLYTGHSDNDPGGALSASVDDSDGYAGTGNVAPSKQRRTLHLSNGETIWDLSGNEWEFTFAGNEMSGKGLNMPVGLSEWNASSVIASLPESFYPSYGTHTASSWSSSNGLGMINEMDSGINLIQLLMRGGSYDTDAGNPIHSAAGVFALLIRVTACSRLGGFRSST